MTPDENLLGCSERGEESAKYGAILPCAAAPSVPHDGPDYASPVATGSGPSSTIAGGHWKAFSREVLSRLTANVRSGFVHNMLVMMSGTAMAQVITVAAAPVLTRLYDPTAFGIAAAFAAIVGFVITPTLCYDQALMLPKNTADAANLLGLSLLCSVAVSLAAGAICVVFAGPIAAAANTPELQAWLWLVPVALFLAGLSQALTAWSTRQKSFHRASISQVARSVTASGSQLAVGFQQASAAGLIGGSILGDACASAALAGQVMRGDRRLIASSLSRRRMRVLAREYYEFPVFSSAKNLLNAISQNVPLLLLAHFFGPAVTGGYALGVRVLQLPMNLVGISFSQVFFQKASEVCNRGGNVHVLFRKVTLALSALAAVPTVLALLFAPPAFALVLGHEWWTAGEYARWLVLWLAVGFVALPANLCAQIYRKQRALFLQNAAIVVGRTAALVVGGMFLNAAQTIVLLSVVGVIFNASITVWMWVLSYERPCPGGAA